MKQIAIGTNKGGGGKTTTTMNIASTMAQVGKSVGLVDLDPQHTATAWLPVLKTDLVQIYAPDQNPNIIIYDTPPDISKPGVLGAFGAANLIILVCRASLLDAWTTRDTATLLKKQFPHADIRLLFNAVKANTQMSGMIEELTALIGVPRLKTIIHERQCYARAALSGYSVLTKEAKHELLSLCLEIS